MIRRAEKRDLPGIIEVDQEAFSAYGTVEDANVFASRLAVFPEGLLVLEQGDNILAYGSSEKWSSERAPAMNEDPAITHDPTGKVFCITGMAVRSLSQNMGLGTLMLNALLDMAHQHACYKVILETTHARDFYLHRGFYLADTRQQMRALLFVMALNLSP